MQFACKQLSIHGRVQGVGFRYWFAERARKLGLVGWVRNRFDGSVEAVVQGPPDAVERMIEYAKAGPDMARIARIDVQEARGNFKTFDIKATD